MRRLWFGEYAWPGALVVGLTLVVWVPAVLIVVAIFKLATLADEMFEVGKRNAMLTPIAEVVRTVRRMVLRSRPWRESQLISRDGKTIYTVRDRDGDERQVLHRLRGWQPVSAGLFSTLPCFEDYHREKFNTAVPYMQNAAGQTPAARKDG